MPDKTKLLTDAEWAALSPQSRHTLNVFIDSSKLRAALAEFAAQTNWQLEFGDPLLSTDLLGYVWLGQPQKPWELALAALQE